MSRGEGGGKFGILIREDVAIFGIFGTQSELT
jgi:hypothetical protein